MRWPAPVRRVARGIPQRRLRRLADRSPRAQRRHHRHRGRILPPQGGTRAHRSPGPTAWHKEVWCAKGGRRMSRPPMLPSGRRGIAFIVPEDWTPQQALAVFELLDDLREVICSRYLADIQRAMRDERQSERRRRNARPANQTPRRTNAVAIIRQRAPKALPAPGCRCPA